MKKYLLFTLAVAVVATAFISACTARKGAPGSASNPIRIYFMPLKGDEAFNKYAPILEKYLEAGSGLAVECIHAKDFISIVEAFGKRKADAAFMNTLGYLMAHDWARAEAHLMSLFGDVYLNYKGEIIARVDSGINMVEDLKGKTVAFADPFSASGYLYPLKLMHDKNVKPKKTIFAGGHKNAVEMVYQGKADAAATYHERPTESGMERDARAELIKSYPDIISKVKIIALTDDIPNGPFAISKSLPEDVKAKLVGAMVGFARSPEGRDTLYNLYNITGFTVGNDSDYDGVRKVLKDLGKSADEVVPGGITFYKTHSEMWMQY